VPAFLPVRSVVVDFDGTACTHDVAEHLLEAFADPSWRRYDEAWERGEMGAPEGLALQAGMLEAGSDEMIAFALDHCPMDPTFGSFVRRCADAGAPVSLASDGFGFYIAPLLARAGIDPIAVATNGWREGTMSFPNGHPDCVNCGTCKMNVVLAAPRPVAFVGEGVSDRFAANYADVVFAKDALVAICAADGVPSIAWRDFDDVWAALVELRDLPGAVAPVSCPGWMPRPSPTG
jgi:2-hydroxy-3-keto-5-methylthiopentenyl-1-phosphate phosphatase